MSVVVYTTAYRPFLFGGFNYVVPLSLPAFISPSPVRKVLQPIFTPLPIAPARASLLKYFILDPTIRRVGPYIVQYDGQDYYVSLTSPQAQQFLSNWWINLSRWSNIPWSQRLRIYQLSGRKIIPDRPSVVSNPVADQTATVGSSKTYTFAANMFTNPDNSSPNYVYSARLSNGSPLPSWLAFNPLTRTFSGKPKTGSAGTYHITVFATDQFGRKYSDTHDLVVS